WLGITAAELLLVVRTYAVWGCNKRFLILSLVVTKVTLIAVLVMSDVGASESGGLYHHPGFLLLTLFLQIRLAYSRKDITLSLPMVC
ncbi:hypothetical protein P692DRAFT_20762226, partial [Suillus brevipes Sb2]